jgi:hypothetical protein
MNSATIPPFRAISAVRGRQLYSLGGVAFMEQPAADGVRRTAM